MKTQIKLPLTLDKYLNPALGKQDKLSSQNEDTLSSGKVGAGFENLEDATGDGQVSSRRKANPRLRIL